MTRRAYAIPALLGAAVLTSCETGKPFDTSGQFVLEPTRPVVLRIEAERMSQLDVWNCGPGGVQWRLVESGDAAASPEQTLEAGAGAKPTAAGARVEVRFVSVASALVGYRAKGLGTYAANVVRPQQQPQP